MQYAILGKTGLKVSRLGFGAMRLPMKGDKVDLDLAVPMLQRSMDLGLNYIDTATMYCNSDSQCAVGAAIKGRRKDAVISTKNPYYNKSDDRPWWKNLEESLKRLDINTIDIYNFHGLNWGAFEAHVKGPGGMLTWMQKARDQGMISHICFSFHDSAEALEKLARTGEFESVTLQYNLIDRTLEKALDACRKARMGVVVMGPVGGGRLGSPSEAIRKLIPGAASVPEVALRFVLANPSVTVALSGMSEIAHVDENCRVAAKTKPLSPVEKRRVETTLKKYKKLSELYCTGCNYCMPCPVGVEIPGNFMNLNMLRVYELPEAAKRGYQWTRGKAVQCIACGKCMPKCPQKINIIGQLRQTVAALDAAYGKVAVRVEPTAARVAARGGKFNIDVDCRLQCHNLSDQELHPSVSFTPANGLDLSVVTPPKPCGPFERTNAQLQVNVKGDSLPPLTLKPVLNDRPAVVIGDACRVAVAPKVSAKSLGAVLKACPPVAAQIGLGSDKLVAQTRRDVKLTGRFGYDAKGLVVQFAASGKLGKFGPELAIGSRDHVWLKLDLDSPVLKGDAKRAKSFDILIGLDADGQIADVVRPKADVAAAKTIKAVVKSVAGGRVATVHFPWAVLQVEAPKAGTRVGMDFRLVHLRKNAPLMQLVWADKNPGHLLLCD